MFVGESIKYTLPKILDTESDKVAITVNLGSAFIFTKYKDGSFLFQPQTIA